MQERLSGDQSWQLTFREKEVTSDSTQLVKREFHCICHACIYGEPATHYAQSNKAIGTSDTLVCGRGCVYIYKLSLTNKKQSSSSQMSG